MRNLVIAVVLFFGLIPVTALITAQRGRLGPGAGLQLNCENTATWSVLAVQRVGPGGQISAVCIPVDGSTIQIDNGTLKGQVGTAGPAGADGADGSTADFVDAERPSGAIDGNNAAFTLAYSPSPAESLLLARNGLILKRTADYNLSGGAVTFVSGQEPQDGDLLQAWYRR